MRTSSIIRVLTVPPLTIFILLCLYACATGQQIDLPPPEYKNIEYKGDLQVEYVDPADTMVKCGRSASVPFNARGYVAACAYTYPKGDGPYYKCRIILPKDTGVYPKRFLDELREHELAHCKGWKHD